MGRSRDPVIGFRGQLDSRVYSGLQGVTTQSFEEANSKNGTQHEATFYLGSLAAGASTYILFRTGAKPVLVKAIVLQFDSEEVTREFYRGPTLSNDGTPVDVYNLSDQNPVAEEVAVFAAPTVISEGTKVSPDLIDLGSSGFFNQVRAGVAQPGGRERVLRPNTDYLFKITNSDPNDASRISGYGTWYEGPISTEILA